MEGHDRSNDAGAFPCNVNNGGCSEKSKGAVTTDSASLVNNQEIVFIQTAHAMAFATPGSATVCVCVLFDSGSQYDGYKTQSCVVVKLYLRRHCCYIHGGRTLMKPKNHPERAVLAP